jgi:hypothetical protein
MALYYIFSIMNKYFIGGYTNARVFTKLVFLKRKHLL